MRSELAQRIKTENWAAPVLGGEHLRISKVLLQKLIGRTALVSEAFAVGTAMGASDYSVQNLDDPLPCS